MPTQPQRLSQDAASSCSRADPGLLLPTLPFRCLVCDQVMYVDDAAALAHFLGGCRDQSACGDEADAGATPTPQPRSARTFHEGYERGFKDGLRIGGAEAAHSDLEAMALARISPAGPPIASLLAEALEYGSSMGQPINGPGWPHLRAEKLREMVLTTAAREEGRDLAPDAPARMLAAVGECRNILASLGKPVGWLDDLLASEAQVAPSATSTDRRAP